MSDHVVYLDASTKEYDKIVDGVKTAILRGAMGRKMPYGRVFPDDELFFILNNGEGLVTAKAKVKSVFNSPKLSQEESIQILEENSVKLNLEPKQFNRFKGKRYLVVVEITNPEILTPFSIDKSKFGNMDDWLPVGNIETVKVA
ncbi:MAG: hypothetical protein SCALA702_03250 [Melioribacteraceae bacterium]|nr:MAG: hypothetical protein SCALA702_03250 [Melioribacteraceae bacterium]